MDLVVESDENLRTHVRVNSKGCCLICLKIIDSTGESEILSISLLLQYLKVDMEEMFVNENKDTSGGDMGMEIDVALCDECFKIGRTVQQILMEVNYCMDKIQKKIVEANGDNEILEEYEKRTGGSDVYSTIWRDTVSRLRETLLKECSKLVPAAQVEGIIPKEEVDSDANADDGTSSCSPLPSFGGSEDDISSADDGENFPSDDSSPEEEEGEGTEKSKRKVKIRHSTFKGDEYDKKDSHIKGNEDESLTCTICSKIFTHKFGLQNHLVVAHQLNPQKHVCNFCGKEFALLRYLTRHRRSVHSKSRVRFRYKCGFEDCSRSFPEKHRLKVHQLLHHSHSNNEDSTILEIDKGTKEKPNSSSSHVCTKCSKSFKNRSSLQSHCTVVHSHPKEYICKDCFKVFRVSAALTRHQNAVHLGVRYKCTFPDCSKVYGQQFRLLEHQKIKHPDFHPECPPGDEQPNIGEGDGDSNEERSGGPPYVCKKCSKVFKTSKRLQKHYDAVHLNPKEFVCQDCGKVFKSSRALTRHRHKVH